MVHAFFSLFFPRSGLVFSVTLSSILFAFVFAFYIMRSVVEISRLFYTEAIFLFLKCYLFFSICWEFLSVPLSITFFVCFLCVCHCLLKHFYDGCFPVAAPSFQQLLMPVFASIESGWDFHFLNLFFLLLMSGFQLKPGCFRHSAFKTLNLV